MKTWTVLFAIGIASAAAQEMDTQWILMKHRGTGADVDAFHERNGQQGKAKRFQNFNWSYMPTPAGQTKKSYEESALFEKVQHPQVITVERVPNDPLYAQMWGLQKIEAAAGWDIAASNTVIVAVIDTGIDFNHEDLRGNLWTGPNGEHGYSATNGVLVAGGQDHHLHGTHVAGTIGAVGNNGVGVPGINWKVQLLAFDFLGAQGSGSSFGAALCIDRMITLKNQGYNIRVSNNSWGHLGGTDELLFDAFTAATDAGILNACAAGNNGLDTDVFGHSPASLRVGGIISVVASSQNDNKAGFSNYGVTSTDLAAPGVDILSCRLGGGYWLLSGTSMASPHVAGALAAMFGVAPTLSPLQMKEVLLHSSSLDSTAFTQTGTGGGRLNLRKALSNPLLQNPPPVNNEPEITIVGLTTNLISVPPGTSLRLEAIASDVDGDPLVYTAGQRSRYMNPSGGLLFKMAQDNLIDRDFPSNVWAITNIPTAREYALTVRFTVSDGRGGGDSKGVTVWMERDEALVRQLPKPIVTIQTNFAEFYPYSVGVVVPGVTNGRFVVGKSSALGAGTYPSYALGEVSPLFGGFEQGPNCYRASVIDDHGNFVCSDQLRINVGSSTLQIPNTRGTATATRGIAPFNPVMDMRASNPSGRNYSYSELEWLQPGTFFSFDRFNPLRQISISTPGLLAVEHYATDETAGTLDFFVELYTAIPGVASNPPPTNPPPVVLNAPANVMATLAGVSQVSLTWLDRSTGETRQDIEVRTKSKGPWTAFRPFVSVPENVQAHTFQAERNTMYELRIKACKDSTCSPYSNTASIRVR